MKPITRLPSVPLICCDPYFSIWSPHDHLYDGDTAHWCGQTKRISGIVRIDGQAFRFLGTGDAPEIPQVDLKVTATSTTYTFENTALRLTLRFTTPLLLEDPELVSRPCTYLDFKAEFPDGKTQNAEVELFFGGELTYEKATADSVPPQIRSTSFSLYGVDVVNMGQIQQKPLCHSGDNIAIDWGYLYIAAPTGEGTEISFQKEPEAAITAKLHFNHCGAQRTLLAAYDDLASINYFGDVKKGYWTACHKDIFTLLQVAAAEHRGLLARCDKRDLEIQQAAEKAVNADYAFLCAASYRQSICAHKLIADNDGNLIFLSKENDSNGCIGTVDVSYPSVPLYLLYNTEYVKGMLRPIFEFANCPVWEYDFAPHDVGRYPYATGQVYSVNWENPRMVSENNRYSVHPDFFQYPAGHDTYDLRHQMPVEECGNMLVMTAAVCKIDGTAAFAAPHFDTLTRWVKFLIDNGADPGEQLCTDDFAGHLSHNINLSAKAIMGIAAFAQICRMLGKDELAQRTMETAKAMAADWEIRAQAGDHTALAFGNPETWSLKYNTVWDRFFGTELFSRDFMEREIRQYKKQTNPFGVPLDSRKSYTKSDWILWCAAMTDDTTDRAALSDPIAHYLRNTESRFPFGDWYDTVTGNFEQFKARSVQGGIFMPILIDRE